MSMFNLHFTTSLKNGELVDKTGNIKKLLTGFGDKMVRVTVEIVRPPKTIEDWSKYYFMIRDEFLKACTLGYTKREFHDLLKKRFTKQIYNKAENISATPGTIQEIIKICSNGDRMNQLQTTQYFSVKGWEVYVDLVKEYLKDQFNFFI